MLRNLMSDECEAEHTCQVAVDFEGKGKMTVVEKPASATPFPPSPSTYATSIKLHVLITLDLTTSNYTNSSKQAFAPLSK
jgi:hypothetical protein